MTGIQFLQQYMNDRDTVLTAIYRRQRYRFLQQYTDDRDTVFTAIYK